MIEVSQMDFCYGSKKALHGIELSIPEKRVTAFIGPSGCGKSTLLRCFNRMNDLVDGARITAGSVRVGGEDINRATVDVIGLRRRVGMVFQKSNPFPRSIFGNVAYGLEVQGVTNRSAIEEAVERSLRAVGRGEGSVARKCDGIVGRSAAAALHCAGDCGESLGDFDG